MQIIEIPTDKSVWLAICNIIIIITAYLEESNKRNGSISKKYNIICVDWSVLSKEVVYFDSVFYTKTVGKRIGEFVEFLHLNHFIPNYKAVHLIGFSLGAHVAGIAGHFIQERTNGSGKIGRITGLDPAGPYPSEPLSERLDPEDALFCDVIHTNMGSLFMGDFGSTLILGHVDFFPGGGQRQAGCEFAFFTEYSIPRRSKHLSFSDKSTTYAYVTGNIDY